MSKKNSTFAAVINLKGFGLWQSNLVFINSTAKCAA